MGKQDDFKNCYGGQQPPPFDPAIGKDLYPYQRDPDTGEFLRDAAGNKLLFVHENGWTYWVPLRNELMDAIVKAVEPYPIPEGKRYQYGTAGVSLRSYVHLAPLT
jgi:hypothetical protein